MSAIAQVYPASPFVSTLTTAVTSTGPESVGYIERCIKEAARRNRTDTVVGHTYSPYDPTWLVNLSRDLHPNKFWFHNSLSQCLSSYQPSPFYIFFKSPQQKPWHFKERLFLCDHKEGIIGVDILEGNIIGGIEFLGLSNQ